MTNEEYGVDFYENLKDPQEFFELSEIIGNGTYGQVFKGRHKKTNLNVAIKTMKMMENELEDLRLELNVLKKYSSHKNVSRFYGAFILKSVNIENYSQLWIVMELCSGGSVADLIKISKKKQQKMKELWIIYILKEILVVIF